MNKLVKLVNHASYCARAAAFDAACARGDVQSARAIRSARLARKAVRAGAHRLARQAAIDACCGAANAAYAAYTDRWDKVASRFVADAKALRAQQGD